MFESVFLNLEANVSNLANAQASLSLARAISKANHVAAQHKRSY